ncbi:MAG: MarR family winged helix-turn-helix transcriptional regulator [Bacteriovoracaceae bacterium]
MNRKPAEIKLRNKVQKFVRTLGVFRSQTPCGRPISVSGAHALMVLIQQTSSESLSQKELQQFLNLDKSNIARLCMNLEKEGYVTQIKSVKDARVRLLSLTKKGEKLAIQLLDDSQKRFQNILDKIPKKYHAQVFHSLDLLQEALDSENE